MLQRISIHQLLATQFILLALLATFSLLSHFHVIEFGSTLAWIVPLLLLLVGAFLYWISRENVIGGVKRLKLISKSIAEGNLDERIRFSGDDEFAEIGKSMNKAVKRLAGNLDKVENAAGRVKYLAERSEAYASESSELTDKLNERSSHLASTSEEVTTTINTLHDRFETIASKTSSASDNADQAGQDLQSLDESLSSLQTSVQSFDENFTEVESSALRIDNFVRIIEDIAEQTNLLALNAAIEAARAGEHGRGFAVVADEVRALAYKTRESTSDITSMTVNLRKLIERSAKEGDVALQRATEASERSSTTMSRVNVVLNEIHGISDEMDPLMVAMDEQTSALDNLSENIQGLSDLCEKTAAQTNKLTKNATELSDLGDALADNMDELDAG